MDREARLAGVIILATLATVGAAAWVSSESPRDTFVILLWLGGTFALAYGLIRAASKAVDAGRRPWWMYAAILALAALNPFTLAFSLRLLSPKASRPERAASAPTGP